MVPHNSECATVEKEIIAGAAGNASCAGRACRAYKWTLALGLALAAGGAHAANHRILSMETSLTPRVEQGNVYYSLEILFDSRPANYWIFYDRANKRLVMEIYDAGVSSGGLKLPRRSPFGPPRIQTFSKHRKSLSGEHTDIYIPMNPGWRCEAQNQGDATVVIQASKELTRSFSTVKRFPGYIVYPLIAVLAGAATFGVILLLPQKG
jgi:hypothetical protein